MNRVYEPISLAGGPEYLARLAACPQKTSDYSLANIWGWKEAYGLEWSFGDSHVWLRQTIPSVVLWAPVGPWTGVDWSACPTLATGDCFTRVPRMLVDIWAAALPGRLRTADVREHWDYVYSVPELTALSGNRFHKKKNLLSQFLKSYDYAFEPLTPGHIAEVLEMQRDWCQWREAECEFTLAAENRAIRRVLDSWEAIPGLMGGVLRVDGRVAAYTVAEAMSPEMLVIHFEKGHTEYKGVYQAINQMFLANMAQGFSLVNREQDLGDDGLRKAKLSYNPVHFLEKCWACLDECAASPDA